MESDEEDFIFYGTPIEREEEISSRKKKSAADASSTMRSLPLWKQEVRDEEGRRRFHGAFTGGFSAGHYNTVGSKEGWTPQSFTSSRKNRAEVKQQNILNFLDEDEKAVCSFWPLGGIILNVLTSLMGMGPPPLYLCWVFPRTISVLRMRFSKGPILTNFLVQNPDRLKYRPGKTDYS